MNFTICIVLTLALLVGILELPFAIEVGNTSDIDGILDTYNGARLRQNKTKVEISSCASNLASNPLFVFDYVQLNRMVDSEELNQFARSYCSVDSADYSLFVTGHQGAQTMHLDRLIQHGSLNSTLNDETTQLGLTRVPWKSMNDNNNNKIWAMVFVRAKPKE
ncbi:hypothetical protein BDF22DRAFT_205010 [Syncephalis plumigaleata]|nr:hypothetical protein BDF22DRAFT_205010 [Syncephalis plumigaleata]